MKSIRFHLYNASYTSSTARGGGGSFKNGKPIGEIGCCESQLSDHVPNLFIFAGEILYWRGSLYIVTSS